MLRQQFETRGKLSDLEARDDVLGADQVRELDEAAAVGGKAHAQHRRNVQVAGLVHNALLHHAAALVNDREEDKLHNVLQQAASSQA